MRRHRFLLCTIALGVFLGATSATANTVTLTDWTTGDFADNAAGGGGAFKATTTGTLLGSGSFMTFCIEFNEHFSYNGSYDFALSDEAKLGGAGGPHPDPISDATKWLFAKAITGGYTAFYTTATGLGLGSGVGAVFQEAIWYLEEERTAGQISAAALALATYAQGQNWNALYLAGDRVYAMNLTSGGSPAQDQLAYLHEATITVNAPDSGSTLALLATGLVALWSLARFTPRARGVGAAGRPRTAAAPRA
jgi:hypothetical protein